MPGAVDLISKKYLCQYPGKNINVPILQIWKLSTNRNVVVHTEVHPLDYYVVSSLHHAQKVRKLKSAAMPF